MNIRFSAIEARIIGSLLEKQITTPDQYPLSLNALVNACNQKSNREPHMQLDEATVKSALDELARRHLILEKSSYGSRVPKYRHIFCNTEFGSLQFTPQQTAIVCELLVRGPQTPGELRTRVARMAEQPAPGVIETLLEELAERPEGAIVVQLAREPGRRDARWAQTFEELPAAPAAETAPASSEYTAPRASATDLAARVAALEAEVAALRRELELLQQRAHQGAGL